jgi:fibronectin-binding autotransporter adhesin
MKVHIVKPVSRAPFAVLGVVVLVAAASAFAAPVNKETTGTDLTAGASWVGGNAPGSGNVAAWAGGTALGGALTIGSDQSWQGIDIQAATAAITTSGAGILTLGTSGINIAGGGVNLTLGNAVSIGAAQSWQIGDGRTLTASGIVSGGSALTVNGNATGILFLSGDNTYSGGTTLQAGSIRIQHNNGLGTGSLGLNGGAIGSDNNTRTLPNAININGNVRIGGNGIRHRRGDPQRWRQSGGGGSHH